MGFLAELFGLTQHPESGDYKFGALDGAPAGKAAKFGVHDMPAFTMDKNGLLYRALGAIGFLNNRAGITEGAAALDENYGLILHDPRLPKKSFEPHPPPHGYPREAFGY